MNGYKSIPASSMGSKPVAHGFSWRVALSLVVLFLLALAARALEYGAVFPQGRLWPLEVDPFYHMRRIWMTVEHYPRVGPFFDYYMAYPLGGVIIWPPLFDFTIVTLAMVVGLGRPTAWIVEHTAALFPPIVGAATILPIYFVAKRLFGRRCALLSSAIAAVLPASISISVVGRIDHHVLEVFLSTCFLLAMMKAVGGSRSAAWMAGVLLGLAFLTWHGASVFVAITVCFFAVEAIGRYYTAEDTKALFGAVLRVLAAALVFLLPYARYPLWMDSTLLGDAPLEDPPQPYMGLSRFHAGFVLLSLAFVCYGYALAGWFRRRNRGRLLFGLAFLGLPLLVVVVLGACGLLGASRAVLDYIGQGDPWLSMVAECQPLFFRMGIFEASFAEVSFGYGIYAFPIAVLLILLRLRRDAPAGRERVLFVVWTLAFSCLVFAKKRFIGEFAVCLAIALSYLIVEAAAGVRRIGESRPKARWILGAVLACALFLAALPAASYFIPLSERLHKAAPRFRTMPDCYREAMDFLREQTPQTSYYEEPTRKPEYGVLAEWRCGEWIQCMGRRPVTANCMGTHLGRGGPFRDSARFLFLEEESEAAALLKRSEVRFVMTAYLAKNLLICHKIAGVDLSPYAAMRTEGAKLILSPTRGYFRTIGSRLHERDGSAFRMEETGEALPALGRLRLIYEGARDEEVNAAWNIPSLKIFEFVEGAKLRGRAQPGASVAASVDVITNRGRTFRYIALTSAAEDGSFALVAPYSTTGCPYRTQAVTSYTISSGTASLALEVPEEALAGQIVKCDLNRTDLPG
ncbi:MAG: STT3 domain-containing protein [Planctomycetota bacterium]